MIREELLALADEIDAGAESIAGYMDSCEGNFSKSDADEYYKLAGWVNRIRDAVERDGECATTVSAYDLLSDDEREAITWIREHGGLDEVEKRIMPEGMEWPTVDGKPVDFVTGYEPSLGTLEAVIIYSNGACEVMSHDGIVKNATEIHVFKPKVLDADGVEIREGDTVYVLGFGEPLTVKGFTDDGRVLMSFHGENSLGYKPSKLTHEQPDTWERLEEDAGKNPFDYCKDVGHKLDTCENSEAYKARDLVRRCRALVEKEDRNE